MKRRTLILVFAGVAIASTAYYLWVHHARPLVITGIVTGDIVIISSEIQGRLEEVTVKQGDSIKKGHLVAKLHPQEWKAEMSFYANTEDQWKAQVNQAAADLKYQEAQSSNQIKQAEAGLAVSRAQVTQAEADLENANLTFHRLEDLYHKGVESVQAFDQARTAEAAVKAHVLALRKQEIAADAAVGLANASTEQIAVRRAGLEASKAQWAAAKAQGDRAKVRLDYTEIRAPIDGIVDVRAALPGEVVNPGQAIVTLINPDELWVRADIEEGSMDRVKLGQKLEIRLPWGVTREGTVFYRGVDADYATQRDVSRTKRDIKTFEIRLNCDNSDRHLAVGMSAYITLPVAK